MTGAGPTQSRHVLTTGQDVDARWSRASQSATPLTFMYAQFAATRAVQNSAIVPLGAAPSLVPPLPPVPPPSLEASFEPEAPPLDAPDVPVPPVPLEAPPEPLPPEPELAPDPLAPLAPPSSGLPDPLVLLDELHATSTPMATIP
jgi:hypothetical protein